jgi:hypothetical protein
VYRPSGVAFGSNWAVRAAERLGAAARKLCKSQ